MLRSLLVVLSLSFLQLNVAVADKPLLRFDRVLLSEEFRSEGAAFADFDGDGDNDIVSGSFWYEGPEYRVRHEYVPGRAFSINEYSQHFFSWAHDFNGDKRPDILVVGFPGQAAKWYANPGSKDGQWSEHVALDEVSGESPDFADLTGDGQPELVCIKGGQFGYARPEADATKPWKWMPVTPKGAFGGFTHGMGIGDVNKDGRPDLLETNGWWEQPAQAGELFALRPAKFAEAGGADMFAYDLDADGDNDVISSQNAHGFGLAWFENRGNAAWLKHSILTNKPEDNAYGLSISQMHALALADINGDGIQDIVTGKRFYAHGSGGDVGSQELPVLYWFQTVRGANGVEFIPHLVDETSGVGTQVTVGDVTGDGKLDILVGNKRGTFLFAQRVEIVSDEQFVATQPKPQKTPRHLPGMADFANGVRSTDALDPEAERKTFLLPQGFEAQLVAAEPDIQKPMNLAFDEKGRLWASMSLEYPYAAPLDKPGRDVIKILEDTDGDGRADKITTFADGLNIPIGLMPYQDGVICCSIPNIWFLRDTDGDGKCDKREVLYGPIGWERDTHGLCNAFRRGFDGWIYACHGFNNNTTLKGKDGHQISMSSGNTFRFRPDGSRIEQVSFGQVNPFGQCFDPFGNQFTADCHTKPVTLILPGGSYESFGKPHDGLGYVPNVMDHLHGSTAIAGIAIVNNDKFPPIFRGNTFDGNVMTSRINRNSLQVSGSSVRAREEPDFLVAGDSWFRPVDLVFGPDGALYVADFYNKIIGHYEVPLPHPGRDRFRGRIWKISYVGDAGRRDAPAVVPTRVSGDVAKLTAQELVAEFASDNLNRRMQAADRLVDHFGIKAVEPIQAGLKSDHETVRLHSLWALQRLNAVSDDMLQAAFTDKSPLVRTHACRVVMARAETMRVEARWIESIRKALSDEHPQVRRASALAATVVQDRSLVQPIIASFTKTPAEDVHLKHALRMALRQQLRSDEVFEELAKSKLSEADGELVVSVSLALKTPAAGQFLIKQLGKININDRARLTELVKAAAQQASPESVGDLVNVATARFEDDRQLQIELLNSVRNGLNQRGAAVPASVRDWALSLSRKLLRVGPTGASDDKSASAVLAWNYTPISDKPELGSSFTIQERVSQDNGPKAQFFSSLVTGEQRTGFYRSEPFVVGKELSFWSAGHIGPPGEPIKAHNFIRLIDATSKQKLFEATPPRNDTAQQTKWNTAEHDGKKVFVEIVDGDTRGAYAWLAVGRFSVEGLNPSRLRDDQRQAAQLVASFKLDELKPALVTLLPQLNNDRDAAVSVAEALVQLKFDSRLSALVECFRTEGATNKLRERATQALDEAEPKSVALIVQDAFKVATSVEQLRIAERLASDEAGAELLATLTENGHAAVGLLTRPTIQPKLAVVKQADLKKRLDALIAAAPAEDVKIEEVIKLKRTQLTGATGDLVAGAALFKKSCAACHKVADQGNTVGPNLDGIGNRGLERLLEDVLAPNRNVDVAFRTTTLVLKDGRALTGLIKATEGQQLTLVDNQGKPQSIALSDIDERVPSKLSLMPANWGEQIPPDDFRHLMTYVLSLRQN